MNSFKIILLFTLSLSLLSCQKKIKEALDKGIKQGKTEGEKEFVQKQKEDYEAKIPPILETPYPLGSLGALLQGLYEKQASESCQIKRDDPDTIHRQYIPTEIVDGYGKVPLRNTFIYNLTMSGNNFTFSSFLKDEISTMEESKSFTDDHYREAKRIIGLQDNLVNYGSAGLATIPGFNSLYYQKSCGSYFEGNLDIKANPPVIEIKASLSAESNNETSVTTVSGKFFSPLYFILKKLNPQSVYAHLLVWETYYEQARNAGPNDSLLINEGLYVSEFDGTLTHRATNSSQNFDMSSRLAANYDAEVVGINGEIKAGYESSLSFKLENFNVAIHRKEDGDLAISPVRLPTFEEINSRLQLSTNFGGERNIFPEVVNYIQPITITRGLVGIPDRLCRDQWIVSDDGFNSTIWETKPSINSIAETNNDDSRPPQCICTITGRLKEDAIQRAIERGGTLDIDLVLQHKKVVDGNILTLQLKEDKVKVTDAPKIQNVSSRSIRREYTEAAGEFQHSYSINLIIVDQDVELIEPYDITNVSLEFLDDTENGNSNSELFESDIKKIDITQNPIKLEFSTIKKPVGLVQNGNDLKVPIKISFIIKLKNGDTKTLVTNSFTLSVPNYLGDKDEPTKESDDN